MEPLIITLTQERDTKNTIRYAEVEGYRGTALGTLYLQKWAAAQLGRPASIRVTIEAVQD